MELNNNSDFHPGSAVSQTVSNTDGISFTPTFTQGISTSVIRTLQKEDFHTLHMIVKSIVAAVSPASHENGRRGLNNHPYHTHKRTSREFLQYQLTHCGAPRVTGSIE